MADIHTALDTGTPLELGFIYEHADSHGRFCPVDGQQRLTTLFLVHLMVFATDPDAQKWLEDFTYETRVTSRRFFDKLTRKRACLASTPTPSSVIRDTTWYSPAWNHDPTVQGALVMLDAIAEKMKLHDDEQRRCTYARRLSSDEAPLRFSFLSTNALGQADSLYMRLNARGKPLTPFETYKARLDKACPEKLLLTQQQERGAGETPRHVKAKNFAGLAAQHCARLVDTEDNATRIHVNAVRGRTLRDGRCLILPGDAQHPQIEVTCGSDADDATRTYQVTAQTGGRGSPRPRGVPGRPGRCRHRVRPHHRPAHI